MSYIKASMMPGKNSLRAKDISPSKAIVFSLIPVVFLLIVSEVALRIWAYYFRTSYERYNYAEDRLELVPNIRFTGVNGDEFLINSRGFLGPEFEKQKPEGVYRILALGDSCTFGSGYWKRAYPAILEGLLNSANPQLRIEVINAGIEGYNSGYALNRLKRELLKYEPDMVTIYIGWNDLMKVNPKNLSGTGKYTWAARLMEKSYLMKGYSKFIFFYVRPRIVKPNLVGGEKEVHAFDDFVPLSFQENMEMMITMLRERGIKPILLTLPTVVRPGMTYEDLERQDVFFPYYADAYSVVRFLSLHRSYNNAIRAAALKYDVGVVDLDVVFNRYEKDDLFWDTMHPSTKGHRIIAQSIVDKVRGSLQ